MPLLNMVGVTRMGTTINLTLVFIKAEKEADRELRLLNAIHELFLTTSFCFYR